LAGDGRCGTVLRAGDGCQARALLRRGGIRWDEALRVRELRARLPGRVATASGGDEDSGWRCGESRQRERGHRARRDDLGDRQRWDGNPGDHGGHRADEPADGRDELADGPIELVERRNQLVDGREGCVSRRDDLVDGRDEWVDGADDRGGESVDRRDRRQAGGR
jgi:hypothetical protein